MMSSVTTPQETLNISGKENQLCVSLYISDKRLRITRENPILQTFSFVYTNEFSLIGSTQTSNTYFLFIAIL